MLQLAQNDCFVIHNPPWFGRDLKVKVKVLDVLGVLG